MPITDTIPIIARAHKHIDRSALLDAAGQYTYRELLAASETIARLLLAGKKDLQETRVAFIVPPSFAYAAIQWGIWRAGGIAVPLCVSHPRPELEYVIEDADAGIIIAHPDFADRVQPVAAGKNVRLILTTGFVDIDGPDLPPVDPGRRALIIYTSGTTGKPKGVVTTHANITAQITSLIESWDWRASDRILGILPLHHVHGIINVLSCALWAGATCELSPKFDADAVWDRLMQTPLTLFMAVPTIYVRLIAAWDQADPARRAAMSAACKKLRLTVSGSAALPVSVFERWQAISGHIMLERYGMTEIGMGLSNPLGGERRPGAVGMPLPGVRVRLVDESGDAIAEEDTSGEIQIRGDNVFSEYWRRPQATHDAFRDGWFLTGDTAVLEKGYYRILGRNSVDIIKTGGYKVSALEIEEMLRTHPAVRECAVVGLEDLEWGERVCAAVVLRAGNDLPLKVLRAWARERIAPYKVPSRLLILDELPRNAMGKVTKPRIKARFE